MLLDGWDMDELSGIDTLREERRWWAVCGREGVKQRGRREHLVIERRASAAGSVLRGAALYPSSSVRNMDWMRCRLVIMSSWVGMSY